MQLKKLSYAIDSYYILLENGYLPRYTVWQSFWSMIWVQLKYSLVALFLTPSDGTKLMKTLYKKLPPKL